MRLGQNHTKKTRRAMRDMQAARRERERRWQDRAARARDEVGYRRAFFSLLEADDPALARQVLERLREVAATRVERVRWDKWRESLASGRRVAIKNVPVELYAGEDLVALTNARAFLADDVAIAKEVEIMQ